MKLLTRSKRVREWHRQFGVVTWLQEIGSALALALLVLLTTAVFGWVLFRGDGEKSPEPAVWLGESSSLGTNAFSADSVEVIADHSRQDIVRLHGGLPASTRWEAPAMKLLRGSGWQRIEAVCPERCHFWSCSMSGRGERSATFYGCAECAEGLDGTVPLSEGEDGLVVFHSSPL